MKILLLTASFVLLLAGFNTVSAQQGDPPPGVPNSSPKAGVGDPPPALTDYSPGLWKEYSFADDNVRFKFPFEPKQVTTTIGAEAYPTHLYTRQSFMMFQLLVSNTSRFKDAERGSNILDTYRGSAINVLKNKNLDPKVVKEENFTTDGHDGRFLVVETNDGTILRTKFFVVGNRIYIGLVMVKKDERHGFNWENNFEVPAMAFLDSIHLKTTDQSPGK